MKPLSLWKAGLLAVAVVLAVALPVPAAAQNTPNYMEQGGSRWVVGGELIVHGAAIGSDRRGTHYYVDPDTSNCSNGSSGTSWIKNAASNVGPWCTVTYALTQMADYDTLHVIGNLNEAVTVPVGLDYIKILGGGQTPRAVRWKYTTGGSPPLTSKARGTVIANIRFEPPSDAAAIKLSRNSDQAVAIADDAWIVGIECWTGKTCIELDGAPHGLHVLYSEMRNLTASGGAAIKVSSQAVTFASKAWIEGNLFVGNLNHIVGGFADSVIRKNTFSATSLNGATTTSKLDLRNGGNNLVTDNDMAGTYSNVGGYWAATNDAWLGNRISTGLTSANPS